MNIDNSLWSKYLDTVQDVSDICDKIYKTNFDQFSKTNKDLYAKLYTRTTPIATEDLEHIIIDLPLCLIDVSEQVSKLQVSLDSVKLQLKKSTPIADDGVKINTVDDEIEYKLLSAVLSSVIERVNREISFSRELIMGAKKLWDSRKASESASPIEPVSQPVKLPDYKSTGLPPDPILHGPVITF